MEKSDSLYRTEAVFNSVYVLESLRPGDLKTGAQLFDELIFPRAVRMGIEAEYKPVHSRRDLISVIRLILSATAHSNHRPIIHLETHGTEEGIQLADGEVVPWRSIIPLLREINLASENNLIVVAMACRGWYLTGSLLPSERAPLFMLVGPPEIVSAGDLAQATRRFYGGVLTDLEVNSGLNAMNENRPYSQWLWKPATAEILFCRSFRNYVEVCQEFVGRGDLSSRALSDFFDIDQLSLVDAELLRLEVVGVVSAPRKVYQHLHWRFLMLDLFPSRRDHFGLTYDICFPEAA